MTQKRVCIIGAGPSGITALKNLLDQEIDVIAFDRNSDVGGNWIYNESESHSSVFETTHIISSKTLSQYEDFTFDDFDPSIADYPSHDELRKYFQAYAKHFNLYEYIQFETMVLHCKWLSNQKWEVTLEHNGISRKEIFTDLIVSNGHHWSPRYPEYPGKFTGKFLHSHQFKKADPFKNKKVLVIGGGNSACDVAVETSRVSKHTSISWRRGYRVIPKFTMGIPTDVFGARMYWLPIWIRKFLSGTLISFLIGSNEQYGLQKASTSFGETHPTLNSELLYKIRHGKVQPQVDIERFEGSKVWFKDGSNDNFDVIIACTGFILAHPFFDKNFIDYSSSSVPLYLKMFHETYENLFFIGMFQPLGCVWPGSELQSKIAARSILGKWKRPKNIIDLCKREVTHPHYKQINTPRHTITVDFHRFMRDLKKQLPKNYISKIPIKHKEVTNFN